jgi:hypothetical protein
VLDTVAPLEAPVLMLIISSATLIFKMTNNTGSNQTTAINYPHNPNDLLM